MGKAIGVSGLADGQELRSQGTSLIYFAPHFGLIGRLERLPAPLGHGGQVIQCGLRAAEMIDQIAKQCRTNAGRSDQA